MEQQPNEGMQRVSKMLKEKFLIALKNKDVEALKDIKAQIGRDRWLTEWAANGSNMADWLCDEPDETAK